MSPRERPPVGGLFHSGSEFCSVKRPCCDRRHIRSNSFRERLIVAVPPSPFPPNEVALTEGRASNPRGLSVESSRHGRLRLVCSSSSLPFRRSAPTFRQLSTSAHRPRSRLTPIQASELAMAPANFAGAFFLPQHKGGAVRDSLTGQFASSSIAERGH